MATFPATPMTGLLAAWAGALGAGPVTFVGLGGVDQDRLADDTWDYAIDPPALSATQERLIGGIGLALLGIAAATLWLLRRQWPRWRTAAASAGAVAFAAGWIGVTGWVAVQPVIGANIGFGLAGMLSLLLVPLAIGGAIVTGMDFRARPVW